MRPSEAHHIRCVLPRRLHPGFGAFIGLAIGRSFRRLSQSGKAAIIRSQPSKPCSSPGTIIIINITARISKDCWNLAHHKRGHAFLQSGGGGTQRSTIDAVWRVILRPVSLLFGALVNSQYETSPNVTSSNSAHSNEQRDRTPQETTLVRTPTTPVLVQEISRQAAHEAALMIRPSSSRYPRCAGCRVVAPGHHHHGRRLRLW